MKTLPHNPDCQKAVPTTLTRNAGILIAGPDALTGDPDGLMFDPEVLIGDTGALFGDPEALSDDTVGLICDPETLSDDTASLSCDTFGLKLNAKGLIFNCLHQKSQKMVKNRQISRQSQSAACAEYCLRDVRATVELYKIWKERLAGIK